jgi:shikimate kinase
MGAGKSTLIKEIDSKENIDCMDLDLHIENLYGPINKIFEDKGENYFRSIEQEEFFKSGKAIYLEVDFDILWKRIENSNRPLVKSGKESVKSLFEKRIDKYQSLQHILSISSEENSYTALLNALELNK